MAPEGDATLAKRDGSLVDVALGTVALNDEGREEAEEEEEETDTFSAGLTVEQP